MIDNKQLDVLLAIADEYLSSRSVQYPMTEGELAGAKALCAVVKARVILAAPAAPTDAKPVPEGLTFDGYHDSDEHFGKTILDLVRSRLETDPDDLAEGDVFYVSACWVQPQEWLVVRSGNPLEVERVSPPANAGAPTDAKPDGLVDAFNTMMWLYRRLPRAYGRVLHVDRTAKALAQEIGTDVEEYLAERDAVTQSSPQAPKTEGGAS